MHSDPEKALDKIAEDTRTLEDKCRDLLRKLRAVLAPDGRLAIHEFAPDDLALDFHTWQTLTRNGLSDRKAAELASSLVTAALTKC